MREKTKDVALVLSSGGFTTFSTFSKEALMMLQSGNYWCFAGYVALSVLAGIALVALGFRLAR